MFRAALRTTAAWITPHARAQAGLAEALTHHCRDRPALSHLTVAVSGRAGTGNPHRVEIARNGDRFTLACHPRMIGERRNELLGRSAGVLQVLARVPLAHFRLVADLSDGDESGAGIVSFCSNDPDAILIPDHGFVRTRGQENHRRVARANRLAWIARKDQIVWRGSTTGVGAISKPQLSADDPELLPRVRLCLALKELPGTDARLTGVIQTADRASDSARLGAAGILGAYVSPIVWNGLKFAIDIDGNTNAWSNLLTRLIMGCCVLKVASPRGYRQWYYPELTPWTHYVPVKSDLSDLAERVTWCRANLDACAEIAARGQAFVMARDFETELAAAANRVHDAHQRGLLRVKAD